MPDSATNPILSNQRMLRRGMADGGAVVSIAPSSWNPETRTISVSASFGADVKRRDRYTGDVYIERLSMDPADWRLDNLNRVGVMLDAHDAWENSAVIGRVVPGSARIEAGQLVHDVVLSDAEGDADLVRKIVTGIIPGVSIGYNCDGYDSDTSGDVEIRTMKGIEPYETSVVPVGADPRAQFRSAGIAQPAQVLQNQPHVAPGSPPQNRSAMDPEQIAANEKAINERAEARAAELIAARNKRDGDIRETAKRLKLDPECSEVRAFLAETDKTPLDGDNGVRAKLIDLAATRSNAQPTSSGFRAEHLTSERETRTAGLEEAMIRRFAPEILKPEKHTENGNRFMGLSTLRVAMACLEDAGVDARYLSDHEIMQRALQGPSTPFAVGMGRAPSMMGTSDFPVIMSNLMGKKLRAAYVELPQDWKQLATMTSADNFKTQTSIQIGEGANLQPADANGEFKQGTTTESSEEWKIETVGLMYNLTRQMLINDQLGAFLRFIGTRGNAANRYETRAFWAQWNANSGAGKTMKDGHALCSTQHSNIVASGGAPSAAQLGATRVLLDGQKGLDGNPIDVSAKYIVGPKELRTAIDTLMSNRTVPTKQSDATPSWVYDLAPIVTPWLTNAKKWYLLADPAYIQTFLYAYLAGQEGVYLETRLGWEVDGLQCKTRLDFGVGVTDSRGIALNAGE